MTKKDISYLLNMRLFDARPELDISKLGYYDDTEKAIAGAVGRTILSTRLFNNDGTRFPADEFVIYFDDGYALKLWDGGQDCCEHRYMTVDDTQEEIDAMLNGMVFLGVSMVDGPTTETNGEPHEVQFLNIHVNKSVVSVTTHNEHNGYYGGFFICAKLWKGMIDDR